MAAENTIFSDHFSVAEVMAEPYCFSAFRPKLWLKLLFQPATAATIRINRDFGNTRTLKLTVLIEFDLFDPAPAIRVPKKISNHLCCPTPRKARPQYLRTRMSCPGSPKLTAFSNRQNNRVNLILTPSDEDLRPTQAQHTAASGSCPKAKDFDDVTQEIISLAITEYRVLLSGKYAFPDPTIELDYLRRAWTKAFKELEVAIESTPTISKLVRGRGSHLCGELKTKVKPLAEFMYEFASGQNKKAIAANRQRSEELKENLTFTFKDIKGRKGIYRHPLFQKGVNAMWFANRRDEGPRYPAVFNLFPKEALALTDCERTYGCELLGTFG
ncbi:hypothetical protein B0H14DRAFT_3785278 [Mycena olivaceomarginata]|nr:hypothetical protein B0H14DRAFT_3785278 [Mycena olivaceomarginata]